MFDKLLLGLPGARKQLLALCALSLLSALLILCQAGFLTQAIVSLWGGAALLSEAMCIVVFFCSLCLRRVVLSVSQRRAERFAFDQSACLRKRLLAVTYEGGPSFVGATGSAALTAMLIEGISQVEAYITLMLQKIASVSVIPVLLWVALFILDWPSGLIALVMFPTIILFMQLIGSSAHAAAERRHDTFLRLSNHFIDTLRGISTLKFFGVSKKKSQAIFESSEQFRVSTLRMIRFASLSSFVLDAFATFALAGVCILLGFRMADGSVSFFSGLYVLMLLPEYFSPLREFAADYHASLDGKNALAHIISFMSASEKPAVPEETFSLSQIPPSLEFREVSYTYPDGNKALCDATFSVSGAKKIGIIGQSGSGKSTLISALAGFISPDDGMIIANATTLQSLNTPGWKKHIATLTQDPYIFHATLRDNIAFFCPDATNDEVLHALHIVGLGSLLKDLPAGLDTLIGEGERPLSGGQEQRIALARMVLDSSRSVLLFDEPTAHLDIETEYALKEKMLSCMDGRLVFFATHRLHWMHDMDYILVMDNGCIVEQGPPADLVRSGGVYAALIAASRGDVA